MKATDLRIGNYVNYEQTTHLITCVNIDYTVSVWVDKKENEYLYPSQVNELKPIPLTEEWLIKFGFVVAKTRWRKGAVVLSKNDNGYLFKTTAINIKHLHQLQNLYFALTNEELTIK